MSVSEDGQYDLTDAGFDSFLSRSVDQTPQLNLDSPQPYNNAVAFDRTQISGPLGDTMRVGKIYLNGADGNIIMNDGTNDRLLIGEQTDGF